ncbi:transcriptional regulator, AraC family [Fontimonas thermophila]|uniref:Transcriptional regulator, AraC family n=1 Tax=Fontimonas thermophila TaxID=1076937 RepID=A0A1I2JDN8_9GAMM|nr:AraC family transcriptional regulator [Fontimonas thermophila]SFF52664.1 transcriptional regulator, AraC family [Fontimonas thermophila]
MEKDSVSISFVHEALAGVRRRGLDPAPLLRRAGIPEGLLAVEQARVSAESFSALWLAVASVLDDEFFGLDSRRMKVGSFATLCYFMLGARNLRGALVRACHFFDIVLDDTAVALEVHDGQAHLVLAPSARALGAGVPLHPFAHETLLVLLHGLMCWLVGRRIPITEARFAYPRPARWREYTVMYSQILRFDAPQTCLVFDADVLVAPINQDERSAKAFLRGAPYNIVLKYKDAHSWSARVRHALRDTHPAQWPDFPTLAQRLGVGPSALRRGLAREGSSFRAIKDALRRDMAIEHLSHSDLPLPEIAQAVGFLEPSAFHRAFKQWTGVRPGEYRRQMAGQDPR